MLKNNKLWSGICYIFLIYIYFIHLFFYRKNCKCFTGTMEVQ